MGENAGAAEKAAANVAASDSAFVELQHVDFGYDDREILHDLSFAVRTGEQVTLSGRTGAGKSTIFKLLLGLYQPGEGKVLIQGRGTGGRKDCGTGCNDRAAGKRL